MSSEPSASERQHGPGSARHPAIAIVVALVVLGSALTGLMAKLAADDVTDHNVEALEEKTDEIAETIEQRVLASDIAIRGLQGLFAADPDVSRDAFHNYVVPIRQRGDIGTLAFVRAFPTVDRSLVEAEVRSDTTLNVDGYPGFNIRPPTEHEDSFAPIYIEPLLEDDPAFGFDLGTSPKRRAAIEKARDTGAMIASEGIQLLGDDSGVGFLMMRPVYDGEDPVNLAERRDSFIGVVQGVFVVSDLVPETVAAGESVQIALYDKGTEMGSSELLFSSGPEASIDSRPGRSITSQRRITVGDRHWQLVTTPGAGLIDDVPFHAGPGIVVIVGTVLTLLIGFSGYTLVDSRDRAAKAAADATAGLRAQAKRLREARDRALEADRLKTTFLANMSHELRTPLNAVIGLSSVLLNRTFGVLNPKQEDYLEKISASGNHLLELIDDMLDLARIEAGREHLKLQTICLMTTVEDAYSMMRTEAERASVELVGPEGPDQLMVEADPRRLRQMVLNLLSNAVKFTEQGGRVGIEVSESDGMADLTVWDTGIGIPSAHLDSVFRPFHQVDSTLARSRGGSGLGLALTKRLVEMHGGRIRVDSREGQGSEFRVSIPISQELLEHPDGIWGPEMGPATAAITARKVLVAEDSYVNRQLMVDLLKLAGCEVIETENGAEAIELARIERPELIVLDIQLPVMDGVTAARLLRRDPTLAATPLLAATAQAMPDEVERIRAAGFDGYLAKPFTQTEFIQAVASVLSEEHEPIPV